MTRRFNTLMFCLMVALGLPYWWLLLDNRPGDARAKPVTMAQLRMLADSKPGPRPFAIETEQVAFKRRPGTLLAAGSGLKRKSLGVMAFRLPVSGGRPILIDTGMLATDAVAWRAEGYDAKAARKVAAGLAEAGLILATHEHPDHMGGLAALASTPVLDKAMLNREQLPDAKMAGLLKWTARPKLEAAIRSGSPQAVAPGVVVIPAPSHTPGSQMIYVRLADQSEYLFTGDIATLALNWQELRARSRLHSQLLNDEDRAEVFSWLLTIRKLSAEAPKLVVIPGHDREWLSTNPATAHVTKAFFTFRYGNKPLSLTPAVR